jgi:hypothetical protein
MHPLQSLSPFLSSEPQETNINHFVYDAVAPLNSQSVRPSQGNRQIIGTESCAGCMNNLQLNWSINFFFIGCYGLGPSAMFEFIALSLSVIILDTLQDSTYRGMAPTLDPPHWQNTERRWLTVWLLKTRDSFSHFNYGGGAVSAAVPPRFDTILLQDSQHPCPDQIRTGDIRVPSSPTPHAPNKAVNFMNLLVIKYAMPNTFTFKRHTKRKHQSSGFLSWSH